MSSEKRTIVLSSLFMAFGHGDDGQDRLDLNRPSSC